MNDACAHSSSELFGLRQLWLTVVKGGLGSPARGIGRFLFRRLRNVLDVHLVDRAVELERRLVAVVERDRRAQGDADVEAVVCGEKQAGADRHHAAATSLPFTFMVTFSGPPA